MFKSHIQISRVELWLSQHSSSRSFIYGFHNQAILTKYRDSCRCLEQAASPELNKQFLKNSDNKTIILTIENFSYGEGGLAGHILSFNNILFPRAQQAKLQE